MVLRLAGGAGSGGGRMVGLVPRAHLQEHENRYQRAEPEPGDAALSCGEHHKRRQQRPQRGPRVAADLKEGLREAMPPPEAMRATREDSGWNTEEPMPTRATANRIAPKLGAMESSTRPTSVNVMPVGRE